MLSEIRTLGIESAIRKKSTCLEKINNRNSNTFNVRISGAVEYRFKEKSIVVNAGEMIFLPKGVSYTFRVLSKEDSLCTIINLNGDFFSDTPVVYSLKHFHRSDFLFNNFADLWNFGTSGDRYLCISLLYELLSFIYHSENSKYHDKRKASIIEPAIEYLKTHIYDTSLKIDMLHNLCGVSHTYFRKIFITEVGMSPKDYIIEKRLSHAKVIIDIGEMDTVRNLALSVGYSDPLYFSKVFKRRYGVSPSNMNMAE